VPGNNVFKWYLDDPYQGRRLTLGTVSGMAWEDRNPDRRQEGRQNPVDRPASPPDFLSREQDLPLSLPEALLRQRKTITAELHNILYDVSVHCL